MVKSVYTEWTKKVYYMQKSVNYRSQLLSKYAMYKICKFRDQVHVRNIYYACSQWIQVDNNISVIHFYTVAFMVIVLVC